MLRLFDFNLTQLRSSSWVITALVLAVGVFLIVDTSGATIDRALSPARFNVVHRAASGNVVVIEMDAQSAAVIKRWPWSRANYATVLDNLLKAGAASIVFDVDFSSTSDEAGDRAFAASLARWGGKVALPTFGQVASAADQRTIDALPIALFRPYVALASVSISPDRDGQVRSMPFGTMTDGVPRPSLSAYIAQRSGAADDVFPIDMSIDPATIPRLSFVAIRDGKFDPAAVHGRNVLIGATAIEMGDRYGTPQWGVIPGVVVQAMAAETLLRGLPSNGSPIIPFLLAAIAGVLMVRSRSPLQLATTAVTGTGLLVGLTIVAQHLLLVTYPLAAAIGMIIAATCACAAREVARRFRTQRMVDEATGLPNFRALQAQPKRGGSATFALFQIDNYDILLAVLGATAISDLIIRVSERLAIVANDALVFRTSERQLAITLPNSQPFEDTLDGLRLVLLQPVEVAGRRVDVAVTAGVAVGSDRAEQLMVDACLAVEDAHRAATFWRQSDTQISELERSISLMGDLDEALAANQIEVYYQPKYNLRDERITSVEALVRWRHPQRGFIGPDTFIPLAEQTNRIGPITLYVLRRVTDDLAEWRSRHADVTAAVNISSNLLSSAQFNAEVELILQSAGIPTSSLIFEITESAALSDPETAIAALNRYRDLDIAVSIDDYGTGQSTLTYLRQLPLTELKIDRSFVQNAHQNKNDALLVRSTIKLAHQLGLKVVAEGVEDPGCLEFLRANKCDLIQGYYISKPVPVTELIAMLDRHYRAAA